MVLVRRRQEGQRGDGDMAVEPTVEVMHPYVEEEAIVRKCLQLLERRGSGPPDPARSIQMECRAASQFLSICRG